MASLEQKEVEARLEVYDMPEVTGELYEMGKTLLDECVQRVHHLDTKSVTLAGYTGAIIGLMISTFPIWTAAVDKWAMILIAAGSLVGLVGGAMALASTWPRKFLLLSDSDWLEKDGFQDPDRLKRYYVSSLHISIASHEQINSQKVSRIKVAQVCLGVMVLCLSIGLGNATYKASTRPFRLVSDRAASAVPSAPQEAQSGALPVK